MAHNDPIIAKNHRPAQFTSKNMTHSNTTTTTTTHKTLTWDTFLTILGDMIPEFFTPITLVAVYKGDMWGTEFGDRLYDRLVASGYADSGYIDFTAEASATFTAAFQAAAEVVALERTAIESRARYDELLWALTTPAPPAASAPAPVPIPDDAPAPVPAPTSAPKRLFTRATPSFKVTEDPQRTTELKSKQERLLISFRNHLFTRLMEVRPQDFALIGKYYLPNTPNRRAEECYWVAPGGDVKRDGTPYVQLLQGVRDHKTGEVHPEWLWGGQTVIGHLNDSLRGSGLQAELVYGKKCFEVYIHDNSSAWHQYRRRL